MVMNVATISKYKRFSGKKRVSFRFT